MIPCRSQSWIKAAILKALRSIICRYSSIHYSFASPTNRKETTLESSLAWPMLRWNFLKNGRVSLKHPWCWLLDVLQALPASTSSKCHAPADHSLGIKWCCARPDLLAITAMLFPGQCSLEGQKLQIRVWQPVGVASDLQPKKTPMIWCIEVLDPEAFIFFQMIVHGSHGIGWEKSLDLQDVAHGMNYFWRVRSLSSVCMDHFNTKLHRGECCIEERF